MSILKYIPVLLLLVACGEKKSKSAFVDTAKADLSKITKPISGDTTMLAEPGAIVISPSARLVDKVKKENPKDGDYDTILDDNIWYMSASGQFLDSLKVKQVRRQSEGAMRFKTTTGKVYTMQLDTIFFGILLFNGKDKPISADIVEIKTDFDAYMRN